MKSKVFIGKGNLIKFSEDYDKAVEANKGRMWSQLYPIDSDICHKEEEFKQAYEWVIGYEAADTEQQELVKEQPKKALIM